MNITLDFLAELLFKINISHDCYMREELVTINASVTNLTSEDESGYGLLCTFCEE